MLTPYRTGEVVEVEIRENVAIEAPIEDKFKADVFLLSKVYKDFDLVNKLLLFSASGLNDAGHDYSVNCTSKFNLYKSNGIESLLRILANFDEIIEKYYYSEVSWVLLTLESLNRVEQIDVLKKGKNEDKIKSIYEKIDTQRMEVRVYGRLLVKFIGELKEVKNKIEETLKIMSDLVEEKECTETKQNEISADVRFGLAEIIDDINELTTSQIEASKKELDEAIITLRQEFHSLSTLVEYLKTLRKKYTKKNLKPAV